MSFTSVPFLVGFAVFLIGYLICPMRLRRYWLLLGSLLYCCESSLFCLAAAVTAALVNWLLGILIRPGVRRGRDRFWLIFGAVIDFGALAAGKWLGTMPLGISFYTFTCYSYLCDVYRGDTVGEKNPATFASYVTMFPKFQMGPITRWEDQRWRLAKPRVSLRGVQSGLSMFALGFCIKILAADKLAILWNELLTIGYGSLSTPLAWLGIASFSIQLYLEWQGYSCMAIGLGELLGLHLPQNFDSPYIAKTVGDFYRRWHMTLTGWFRDYVYIPLGGNRRGTFRTVCNILIVWLFTSVWHGLGWNFLLWGMSIGVLIVLEKLFLGKWMEKLHVLPHIYVLFFIMLSWCCFKIGDVAQLGAYFSRLFPFFGTAGNVYAGDFRRVFSRFWPYLAAGVFCCFPLPEKLVRRYGTNPFVSVVLAGLFWWAFDTMLKQGSNPMMYLNF